MIEFMITVVLGNLFMFSMTIVVIGMMFVLRVVLNVWFDTDFMKRITAWFKKMDARVKAQLEKKKKIEEKNEKTIFLIGDKDEL